MSEPIFVSGNGKTGTSSVVAILNSSPDCCLLYESYLCREGGPAPRGKQFLDKFPAYSPLASSELSLRDCYTTLGDRMARDGYSFLYVGDKVLISSLSASHRAELAGLRSIFMVRDLRTWLCKNVVVNDYDSPGGLSAKARAYVAEFIGSFRWRDALRLSMESFILENRKAVDDIFKFLDMEVPPAAKKWWNTPGNYPEGSPKSAISWWQGHDSSKLRPQKLDTQASLKRHEFWDLFLPVFDKYYQSLSGAFSEQEILGDLKLLEGAEFAGLTIEELYEDVESVSFGSGMFGSMGHRSSNPHTKPLIISKSVRKGR